MSFSPPQKEKLMSKKYLDFVRTLPCINCGKYPPSEAHHIKGIGHFSGVSMKASDILTMPLCTGCHRFLHDKNILIECQFEWVLKTIIKARKLGIIRIG